jgi:Putative auto-transporter adhesin, head GIN domain
MFSSCNRTIIERCAALLIATSLAALLTTDSRAEFRISFSSKNQVVGSGKVVDVARNVAAFDRIEVSDGIRATLKRGNEARLTVSADDNIEPLVETVVNNGTLVLRMKPNVSLRTKNRMSVAVIYTKLEKIVASDGSAVDADALTAASFVVQVNDGASLKAESVSASVLDVNVADGASVKFTSARGSDTQNFRVSDGARLTVDAVSGGGTLAKVSDGAKIILRGLNVKALETSVTDGASAELSGVAQQQNFSASDGASINARELNGEAARVRAVDGGSLKAGALKTLDVEADESASVRYAGEPTVTLRSREKLNVRKY